MNCEGVILYDNITIRFVVLAFAICASIFVSAGNKADEEWWVLSDRDAHGNAYLVDGISKLRKGGAFSYNTHFFYREPVDEIRSAQIEYYIDCSERSLREARYVDFNSQREPIGVGDSYDGSVAYRPAAGTIGSELVAFSCASEGDRMKRYHKIDSGINLWSLGESLISEFAMPS